MNVGKWLDCSRCKSRSAFDPIRLGYDRGFLCLARRVNREPNVAPPSELHLHVAIIRGGDNTEIVLRAPVSRHG